MVYARHGNCKAWVYLFKVKVNGETKFLKLGSTEDINRRKNHMQNYEFGVGEWILVAKVLVKHWRRKENLLHRKCGFGMMEVKKKNGNISTECYEPDMKKFIKDLIKKLK
jgi:hypothetical protein